jgi:long-chain fatty acid transport protein
VRNCSKNGKCWAKASGLLGVFLAGMFCASGIFADNGDLPIGYGTKNKAMAGAGMALPEEAAAVINNPATALAVAGQMQTGLSVFHPRARYSTTESSNNGENGAFTIGPNAIDSKSSYRYLPYFATSAKVNEDSAVAVALYTRAGMALDYRGGTATFDADGNGAATYPGTYGDGDAKWSTYQIMLDMAYAWQLNEKIAFGVTGVLASRSFDVSGIGSMAPYTQIYASSGGSVMPKYLSGNGKDWTYGAGVKAGLHAQLTPAISVGLMYQSKIYMTKINDYSDLIPGYGKFDMPADLKIGITWNALDNLALSVDAEHIFYAGVGAYSNPIENLFNCPTANQGGTDVSACLGGKNGASLGWESINIYKFGGRWKINDKWALRAGFALTDQPIKNPQTSNNLLTPYLAEAHYTLGFSMAVNDHAELNFSAYYSEEESQIWPNFFDTSQDVKIEEDQFDFELSYSWKF